MNRWIQAPQVDLPDYIQKTVGGHPLVGQTLVRRGLRDIETIRGFLDPNAYSPASPFELPGMDKAVDRMHKAILNHETICVWGDFDVDGQTSTTVLVSTLNSFGVRTIYHIPNRETESHGVNLPYLKRIIKNGVDLIITCDTGISACEEVAYAQQRGIDIIITDHHDLPEVLPKAFSIINPKMLNSNHPLITLPGVGVAYKLAEALCQSFSDFDTYRSQLDLVALGIVADLALLTGDTRYLLQKGLQSLRNPSRLGLKSMLDIAELNAQEINEEHIAFEIAPRLNALGRLSDANNIVDFFTTPDIGKARTLAYQLEGFNEQRKLQTKQVFQAALAQINNNPQYLEHPALVLSHPAWPAGIIGIVASRLVERYQKPVLLISTPYGKNGRGSARSIAGINITSAIAEQRDMLVNFGGHPMAAGFTIPAGTDIETTINKFRKAIGKTIQKMIENQPPAQRVFDEFLPLSQLTLELVKDFERLGPFGPGNPPLTLVSRGVEIVDSSLIGKTQEHVLISVKDIEQNIHRLIWWQGAGWQLPEGKFDLVYQARTSTSSGKYSIQLEWIDSQEIEENTIDLIDKHMIDLIDYRSEKDPLAVLNKIQNEDDIQIWSEGENNPPQSLDRTKLISGKNLAIWFSPPGWAEIHAAISHVSPQKIYLFAVDPDCDQFNHFIERLIGLIKYAITHYEGQVNLKHLAANLAHQEMTIQTGIAWLQACGYFKIRAHENSLVTIEPGNKNVSENLHENQVKLQFLLDETAAFRKMIRTRDCKLLRNDFIA